MLVADERLDLTNKLDNDMFNHIAYVSNRILMLAKTEGIGKEQLTEMGKYLWRLFRVMQAYNNKRRDVTLSEIVSIVSDFRSVFVGG